jgi:alkylation response protein AidB-like acyl-CoA dehydrogenase
MELTLDEARRELRDTVARFCSSRFGLEGIASREGAPLDRAVWRELGDLGIFGMLLPESDGGSDLGVLDAVVAFEQLGLHLVNGPVIWSLLGARHVPGAASGDRLVGGVDPAGDHEPPVLIEYAGDIDDVLVLGAEGVYVRARADLPAHRPLEPLDPLTPVGGIDIGGIESLSRGEPVAGPAEAARLRALGVVLSAAMLVGLSDAALETARRYALDREQFGAPIGSFQAIKHLLADMYVRTTLARSATYAAATALDEVGSDEVGPAASAGGVGGAGSEAKLLAGDAALGNARTAVQVLGGMGYTWDMPPNYLLKRAWVLDQGFGDADAHALAVSSALPLTQR